MYAAVAADVAGHQTTFPEPRRANGVGMTSGRCWKINLQFISLGPEQSLV